MTTDIRKRAETSLPKRFARVRTPRRSPFRSHLRLFKKPLEVHALQVLEMVSASGHGQITDFRGMGLPHYGGAPLEDIHWRPLMGTLIPSVLECYRELNQKRLMNHAIETSYSMLLSGLDDQCR